MFLIKKKILSATILIFILSFSGAKNALSGQLMDEFTSIYHSSVILEVGVKLNDSGKPEDSCYLKTIKGNKDEIEEVLSYFGIRENKKGMEIDQKRIMSFYKNRRGDFRSMDLIREGTIPYSDEDLYKPYIKMVKRVDRCLDRKEHETGMIVIDKPSTCRALSKNKYFSERYRGRMDEEGFSVGGNAGVFSEFSPIVKIDCEERDS